MARSTRILVLLGALVAGYAGFAGAASAQETAQATTFTFAITGAPAGDLAVRTGPPGDVVQGITDSRGQVDFALRPGRLHVVDTQTGTVLADRYLTDPPARVRVPLPLRLRGRLVGFDDDPTATEVHFGYGERLPVADYQRRRHDLPLTPQPGENRSHGLDLPDLPADWREVRPGTDGGFTSGWLPVTGPVEVIARHRDGRTAMVTYEPDGDVEARATRTLDPLHVQFGARLTVEVEEPDSDLPLALMLGISELAPGDGDSGETARRLALLNRVDRDLGRLLSSPLEHPLSLDGETRLVGLPPLDKLRLYVTGPTPGIAAEREIEVPRSGTIRLRFTQKELLGDPAARTGFSGIARYADGSPAAGATVVYSSYPHRFETQADEHGQFTFDNVPSERRGVVLIDDDNPDAAPPFDRVTKTFRLDPPASQAPKAANGEPRTFTLPKPEGGVNLLHRQSFDSGATAATQLDGLPGENYSFCDGNYTQSGAYIEEPVVSVFPLLGDDKLGDEVEISGSIKYIGHLGFLIVDVVFPHPGPYMAVAQYTPFIMDVISVDVTANKLSQRLFLRPDNLRDSLYFVVFRPGDHAKPVGPDLQVSYPSLSDGPGPFQNLTDTKGQIQIRCLNTPRFFKGSELPVFVADEDVGYFDGFVDVKERGANIHLSRTPPD